MLLTKHIALAALVIAILTASVVIPLVAVTFYRSVRPSNERYITTVHTNLTEPTQYAGVALDLEYYYTKSEYRVRLVATLPEGFPYSALNDTTTPIVRAIGALPAWACHTNPLVEDTEKSFVAKTLGTFLTAEDDSQTLMSLNNLVADLGDWTLSSPSVNGQVIDAVPIYLGQTYCAFSVPDSEICGEYYIGEMTFRLRAAVDREAWGAKYDAAPV